MIPQQPRCTTLYALTTKDFRASSSALFVWPPHFKGFGTNLQNQTDDLKSIFIPDDGYELGKCDQKGAEALIVSYLCKAGKYRDLFIHNISPHSYVALHLFKEAWKRHDKNIDFDYLCQLEPRDLATHPEWKKAAKLIKSSDKWSYGERYYFLAKQTSHSSNYGIKWPTFMMNVLDKSGGKIALSRKDAEFFLAYYRTMFPEIPMWNAQVAEIMCSKHKVLYNLFGHPREFFGEPDDALFREAYAFVPQSTVAEITHMAFRNLQQQIETEKRDWHLLNNEHDSYLSQFPPTERAVAMSAMKHHIERELISPEGIKFKMQGEAYVGLNWQEMTLYEN
jgi:hypothetical protein